MKFGVPKTPDSLDFSSSPEFESEIAKLTGYSYNLYAEKNGRKYGCPLGCKERFLRLYDVERHTTASHVDQEFLDQVQIPIAL